MVPPHPGAFIREEILDELGLSVSEAAKVLECAALSCPT
jgi:plasmid maintenance system antidote protein VapI